MTIPKTQHHEGLGTRITPLFPELRRELDAWRRDAPNGWEFVMKKGDQEKPIQVDFLPKPRD